jgi:CRISPR-associated protein Cas2
MFIVVAYDVADDRRRNRIARMLEGHGDRVQESVFELFIDRPRLRRLQRQLLEWLDEEEDRIRYYRLCNKDLRDVCQDGTGSRPSDTIDYIL